MIAPILFNIFVNDQPTTDQLSTQPPLLHSHFADDFAVWAASKNPHHAATKVQEELTKHEQFCNNWRIKLNATKTQVVLFTRSGKGRKDWRKPHSNEWAKVSINIGGQQIFADLTANLLGVTFNSSMSFGPHFTEIINRCHSRLNLLKCLRGTDWGANSDTLLHLYKQVVRPILDYGSVSFLAASKSQKLRLQRIQNQGIRIALRLPRYTPVLWLHEIAGLVTLDERWKTLALKYVKKNSNPTTNLLIGDFIELYSPFCFHQDRHKTPLGIVNNIY